MASNFLRRYTNLAGAIHILKTKKITLLDPVQWDDGNDVHFMNRYRQCKKAKSVHALCFSQVSETYHHWRVFAPGGDGVCLDLNREKFLDAFNDDPAVNHQSVNYEKIENLRGSPPSVDQLPFVKRLPYDNESEYRIVHTSLEKEVSFPSYDISMSCINGLILSPWMPKPLVSSVKDVLKSIPDCKTLKIYQTTLLDNQKWKDVAEKVR